MEKSDLPEYLQNGVVILEKAVSCLPEEEQAQARESLHNIYARCAGGITDKLTRLYSSDFMEESLSTEIMRAQRQVKRQKVESIPLTIFYFDINCLKDINDTYSHDHGNEFLKTAADYFRSVFQRGTDIIGRFLKGDEFLVIAPFTPKNDADTLYERLQKEMITQLYQVIEDDKVIAEIPLRFATGVYTYEITQEDVTLPPEIIRNEMVASAEKRMYLVKTSMKGKDPYLKKHSR